MAQQQSLTDKKMSEMTSDDVRSMMKPLGFPALPYPMVKLKKDDAGHLVHTLGVVQDAGNPMIVYSEQSAERVNGMLFRQMPIPSMMFMLRDLLTKSAPESKNKIMTVFGDAAFGKSHLFKLLGSLTHPQGAISVDCGGMNMRELFFRTVIDYGAGVKEQFEKRVLDGKVSKGSLEILEAEFPGSVLRKFSDKNKLITEGNFKDQAALVELVSEDAKARADANKSERVYINWDAIGARRQETVDGKTNAAEDRGDAAIRAQKVLSAIYDKEGLDVQSNAFGIKTVPGEVFESISTGRPLFLDEFNKSKKGTLDAFQTWLQFANGEIDRVTIYNPMAQSGDGDSPKALTIDRSDLKMGWFVGVAGNDSSDGDTTQDISVSMKTRLNPMYVGEPSDNDWKHRISQVWTGLPVVTLYNIFEPLAKSKPDEFSKFLVDLRKLGLDAEEVKAIPPHEIYFLQNFQETVTAINQVSQYYSDRLQLANPESPLLQQKAYENLADEISSGYDRIHVSFRKVIADFNKAVQSAPEVSDAKEAVLSLDLSAAFAQLDMSAIGKTMPGWHRFGGNMVRAIEEDVANDTIGMPLTRAALLKIAEENGILPSELKEAKASDSIRSIAELLKYDDLKDLGGTDELISVRNVLMACLKSQWPNLRQQDENVIPLAALGRALREIDEQRDPSPKSFIIPNDDIDSVNGSPLLVGRAVPVYDEYDPTESGEYQFVDFRSVLASLVVPEYSEGNRKLVWPVEMLDRMADDGDDQSGGSVDLLEQEAYKIAMGESKLGFNLSILKAVDAQKENVFLFVVEDKAHLDKTNTDWHKYLIIGPEAIAPQLQAELAKQGVSYLVKSEESSVQRINEFLAEGARVRGEDGQLASGNTQEVIEGLIKAFSAICELEVEAGNDPDQALIKEGSTLGQVIHNAKAEPAVFTSIVKPKVRASVLK
ncbi:MAG: hypothetical protein PW788_15730 [Micavibrio sp.]|nr:hypothetical protein [Micavibrio sp.]